MSLQHVKCVHVFLRYFVHCQAVHAKIGVTAKKDKKVWIISLVIFDLLMT